MLSSIASLPEAPECKSGVLFICRLPGPLCKTSKQILNLRGFRKSRTEKVMNNQTLQKMSLRNGSSLPYRAVRSQGNNCLPAQNVSDDFA